jgi:hypothetical protein
MQISFFFAFLKKEIKQTHHWRDETQLHVGMNIDTNDRVGNIIVRHLSPNEKEEYPCITRTLKVVRFYLYDCIELGVAFKPSA